MHGLYRPGRDPTCSSFPPVSSFFKLLTCSHLSFCAFGLVIMADREDEQDLKEEELDLRDAKVRFTSPLVTLPLHSFRCTAGCDQVQSCC